MLDLRAALYHFIMLNEQSVSRLFPLIYLIKFDFPTDIKKLFTKKQKKQIALRYFGKERPGIKDTPLLGVFLNSESEKYQVKTSEQFKAIILLIFFFFCSGFVLIVENCQNCMKAALK